MPSIIGIGQTGRNGEDNWISVKLTEKTFESQTGIATGTWRVYSSSRRETNPGANDYISSVNPEHNIWLFAGFNLSLADSLLVRGKDFGGADDTHFNTQVLLLGAKRVGPANFYTTGRGNAGTGMLYVGGNLLRPGPVEWGPRTSGAYGG